MLTELLTELLFTTSRPKLYVVLLLLLLILCGLLAIPIMRCGIQRGLHRRNIHAQALTSAYCLFPRR